MKSSKYDKKLIAGDDWNSYFRETYGSKNVTWENPVNSIDDIIDTPSLVTRFQPKQLAEFAEESGWSVGPLKNGSKKGILFEDGGGFAMNRMDGKTDYIQYHPGGGHHGKSPYFKISSSMRGTKRFKLNGDVLK